MHYSKFEIQNYKGIKELILDLDKEPKSNVFTLVGLNESGKTSILEAIYHIQNEMPETEFHKLIPKDQKLNFNEIVSIRATLKLDKSDEKKIKEFVKTLGYSNLDEIKTIEITRIIDFRNSEFDNTYIDWEIDLIATKGKSKKSKTIKSETEEWHAITDYIEKNLIPRIIYYPDFLFDFPSRIYLEEYENESEEQATYREVLSDILDSMGGNLNIQSHILDRLKSDKEDAKEALESTINKMSAIVSKTVFQAWETLFKSQGKEILLKTGKEDINDEERYYLEVRLKEGPDQYQIAERSLGFKWFFTFLLFTEFRKKRSTDNGEILFLLDEPASNLHSTAQKNLLKTFEKLVENCRLIYTTHSHHLIHPNWLSGAYIIRNKNLDYDDEINFDAKKTDVEAVQYRKFASQNPEQRTYFQPILDALEYQPGLLEQVPEIIITEGKNDYYTFRYINEVILDHEFKNLNFYPGAGADKNQNIISLYLAWNRKFKILLDGDDHGVAAKERYLNEFGPLINDKVITLKDINKAFNCTTEFLFEESERLLITKKFDSDSKDYNKSKFNSAVQIALVTKEKVNLSEKTIDKFKLILSAIL